MTPIENQVLSCRCFDRFGGEDDVPRTPGFSERKHSIGQLPVSGELRLRILGMDKRKEGWTDREAGDGPLERPSGEEDGIALVRAAWRNLK